PAYLEHVLKTLRDHKRLAAQVALSTMYQAMKNILGITTVTLDEENSHLAQDDLPISREDLLAQIKRHIGDQLESVYKKTGKAPETVLSRYRSILNTYFEDLIWLGHTASLVKYMNHKPANEILKPEWDKHKGRLEYLIKKGRKHLQLIFRQN
ncbi:MAG: hypothetical protein ACE5D1_05390, partial [Fidelibacterota bacterium]